MRKISKKTKIVLISVISLIIVALILAAVYFLFIASNKNNNNNFDSGNGSASASDNNNINFDKAKDNISYKDVKFNDYIFVIMKNNNNFDFNNIYLVVTFFDKDNKNIGTTEYPIDYFEKNTEQTLTIHSIPVDTTKYEINFKYEDVKNYITSYLTSIKVSNVVNNSEEKSIDFTIANTSTAVIQSTTVSAIYYKDGDFFFIQSSYLPAIKPGESINHFIDYPIDEKDYLNFTDYKLLVDNAISYNFES